MVFASGRATLSLSFQASYHQSPTLKNIMFKMKKGRWSDEDPNYDPVLVKATKAERFDGWMPSDDEVPGQVAKMRVRKVCCQHSDDALPASCWSLPRLCACLRDPWLGIWVMVPKAKCYSCCFSDEGRHPAPFFIRSVLATGNQTCAEAFSVAVLRWRIVVSHFIICDRWVRSCKMS